jgi:signal transduction histidine kinase
LAAIAIHRVHRLRAEREAAQARELLASRRNESELEQRAQERTAELQRSLEDQRQLLSIVAHAFRNPLAVVDGAVQNIARGLGGGGSDVAVAGQRPGRRQAERGSSNRRPAPRRSRRPGGCTTAQRRPEGGSQIGVVLPKAPQVR